MNQPVPPEVLSAILRDPDDPRFPDRIGLFCDACGVLEEHDYLVSEEMSKAERLGVARTYLRTQGWQCDRSGDFCPAHKAQNDACPGVGEYGHGLTGTTVHVGCCPASSG